MSNVITSILENDLYKFSMSYYYQVHYPNAWGRFTFHDRNDTEYTEEFVASLKEEFAHLATLSLQQEEFDWAVGTIGYIPRCFWEWLRQFRFEPEKIGVWLDGEHHLHIEVADAMYKVTFYEIPILAIVSELYHRHQGDGYQSRNELLEAMTPRMEQKVALASKHNLYFADFGMRRRFNTQSEEVVVEYMKAHCPTFTGTSTVSLAMKYNIRPIGTMAHECFMFQAAVHTPKEANYEVMEQWVDVYDGNLGTVLTDTYTVDAFLRNFSMKLAKLYDGVRHDSGDPKLFGDKIIRKYESYGIDPLSKTIVFSDGLDFATAAEIKEYFAGRIKVTFGIGTNLTCDLPDVRPMNIVMKLKECRINERQPIYGCVKLSDVTGKAIGTREDIENYKYQLGIR
ncbi:MAG: nicotinate phosphoribosyltransferase [Tidjanibacter sp.]|nr:nicotinate phosphoribosyltransferase [Tidjanibacter sp.]MBR3853715.1 nicotinate phosphoribosyltransferase [Tidjanibacter sp.]